MKSKDEIARSKVSFLMKTPIEKLLKSKIYKKMIKESTKEHGRAWYYFTNISVGSKKPWLWRFKDGKD